MRIKQQYWRFLIISVMNCMLCFIAGLFLVWWSIAPLSFILYLSFPTIRLNYAFFSGLISTFCLWFGLTLYISNYDHFRTSEMLSQLFFSQKIPYLFNILTGLLGGVIVGLSALSATHTKRLIVALWFNKYPRNSTQPPKLENFNADRQNQNTQNRNKPVYTTPIYSNPNLRAKSPLKFNNNSFNPPQN